MATFLNKLVLKTYSSVFFSISKSSYVHVDLIIAILAVFPIFCRSFFLYGVQNVGEEYRNTKLFLSKAASIKCIHIFFLIFLDGPSAGLKIKIGS